MAQTGSNKKVANSLVALSSAAVLAVYAAGYSRTRSAASRLEAQAVERRPVVPLPLPEASPAEPVQPSASVPVRAAAPTPIAVPVPPPGVAPAADPPAEPAAPVAETKPAAAAAVPDPAAPPAPAATPAPPAPAALTAPGWKDGTYYGWGSSRHGDIQAAVVIESGRISSATIAQCLTRYSCSVIDKLPPEVAQRQSPEVDYVSGATQSANAFYYAVVDALGKAK
ncbi:MAG: FMN-binding protein [Candidatus Sulfopaludibacter sp.]|nr:FMN-binding protein [Candidatus Sulfopaludibacter sp.]